MQASVHQREIAVPPLGLSGTLNVPDNPRALVVFVHGSGSSRLSPRNRAVAYGLNDHGMATLLFDLLTVDEEAERKNVFDIGLLVERLIQVIAWIDRDPKLARLPLGLFGASTGAAAALVAAGKLKERIGAIVSRGGRPDLAGSALGRVTSPTLLIVGGNDFGVIELNEEALKELRGPKAIEIVQSATHLFPEPGALESVIAYAADWFETYLVAEGSNWPRR
ncbi:MAG TPA: alpha/beta hydrolase [Methylocella sp.]|nr:alpha/beta hydrolase [Methylocella sp.]